MKNLASAREVIASSLSMSKIEEQQFQEWVEKNNTTKEAMLNRMGKNALLSIHKSLEGFSEVSNVMFADWGYKPQDINKEGGTFRKILIAGAKEDNLAHIAMQQWMAKNYNGSELKVLEGGHLTGLFKLQDLLEPFLTNLE